MGNEHQPDDLNQTYQMIFERAMEGIVIIQDQCLKFLNPQICTLLGYSREELLEMVVFDLVVENDRARLKDWNGRRINGEDLPHLYQTILIAKDGRWVYVEINASLIQYKNEPAVLLFIRDLAERRKMENELKERQALLAKAEEIAHIGSFHLDLLTKKLSWSSEFEKIIGVSQDKVYDLATFMKEYIFSEDVFYANQLIKSALQGQSSKPVELRIQRKDGQIRVILVEADLVMQDGQVVAVDGVVQDITEKKDVDRKLSIAMFSLDRTPVGVYWFDLSGKAFYANQSACDMLGYTSAEIMALNLIEIDAGLDPENWVEKWEKDPKKAIIYETRFKRKDGVLFPVQVYANFLVIDGVGYVCQLVRDISVFRMLVDRLRESELRFHAMADFSIHWEYWVEPDGKFGYVAPACLGITGYRPEEFMDDPELLSHIIYPEDFEKVSPHLTETAETDNQDNFEFRVLNKAGEIRWISHHCRSITSWNGDYLGRHITNQDITERKYFEQLELQSKQQLEKMAQQVIWAQENERRRISQDLHDEIGQEMTALILRMRALKKDLAVHSSGSEQRINEITHQLEDLMEQIRTMAHQLRPPALGNMPLVRVLESVCRTFEQQSDLTIDLSASEDFPEITDDQSLAFYRMLQEGLTNIIKHAGASAVWVNLDCAEDEINLSIEDNGAGFIPNQTASGIGLLGMSERFRLLGGTLEIDSSPGKGTHITGTLPLHQYLEISE